MANITGTAKRRCKENMNLTGGVDPYSVDKSIFTLNTAKSERLQQIYSLD